jgi:hypothetical protein
MRFARGFQNRRALAQIAHKSLTVPNEESAACGLAGSLCRRRSFVVVLSMITIPATCRTTPGCRRFVLSALWRKYGYVFGCHC